MKNKAELLIFALMIIGAGCCAIGGLSFLVGFDIDLSYLTGFGAGLFCAAFVVFVIRKIFPSYAKKQEIEQNDERLITIRGKASNQTIILSFVVCCVVMVVANVFDQYLLATFISCAMVFQMALFFILCLYYKRKL